MQSPSEPTHPASRWYASHHAWLVHWLQRRMGCPHSAADLAQDTFVRVLSAREVEQVAEPRAFLTTLAKRVMYNHWERRALEQAHLQALADAPAATAPSAQDIALVHEALQTVDRDLDGLPPKVRQAFLLHRLDELTHVQIADRMGISVASVERYVKQACLHCSRPQAGAGSPADPRRPAKARPVSRQRRSIVGGSTLLLATSIGAGYLAHRSRPLDELFADVQTGTAEARHLVLPDGSSLDLNARSAADLRFDEGQRLVRLRSGELLVQVARDAAADPSSGQPPRPFVVQTRHGTAQAMGTRYLVRQEAERSLVVVLEHSVALRTGDGAQRLLHEGQAAWMDGSRIELAERRLVHSAGWTEGVLDVRDEPLGDVVAALRPWRRGPIRISPAAARLRVFGVFPLADTQRTLQALVDTQPITVTTYGPLLTTIDLQ